MNQKLSTAFGMLLAASGLLLGGQVWMFRS